jgi:hypothetical protein
MIDMQFPCFQNGSTQCALVVSTMIENKNKLNQGVLELIL